MLNQCCCCCCFYTSWGNPLTHFSLQPNSIIKQFFYGTLALRLFFSYNSFGKVLHLIAYQAQPSSFSRHWDPQFQSTSTRQFGPTSIYIQNFLFYDLRTYEISKYHGHTFPLIQMINVSYFHMHGIQCNNWVCYPYDKCGISLHRLSNRHLR